MVVINVLITKNNQKYENFRVVRSVKSIAKLTKIDNLVYNTSDDTPQEVIDVIRTKEIGSLTYLRDGDLMDESLKLYIGGIGGKLVEDEFYLSSTEAMDNLTEALKTGNEIISVNSIKVLEDFYSRIADGEKNFKKPYIQQVKRATEKVRNGFTEKDNELQTALKTAVNMFDSVSNDLNESRRITDDLRGKVETVQQKLESAKSVGTSSSSSSKIFHFSAVRYKERKPITVIKEIGNVPFLMSFTLGLMHYIDKKQNKSTRLIIVLPVGDNYERIYGEKLADDTDFISSHNHNSKARYQSKVTFTNHPIASVMNKLFRSTYDNYIVLDRSESSIQPIVTAEPGNKYLKSFTAVQSNRILTKFPKINRKKSFSSLVAAKGTMFTIPLIENYGTKIPKRIDTYFEVCGDMYSKLIGQDAK